MKKAFCVLSKQKALFIFNLIAQLVRPITGNDLKKFTSVFTLRQKEIGAL
jgi:hypothetical protein